MLRIVFGSTARRWRSVEEAAAYVVRRWPDAACDDDGTLYRDSSRSNRLGRVEDGDPLEFGEALLRAAADELYEEVC